jgi:protein SYS1
VDVGAGLVARCCVHVRYFVSPLVPLPLPRHLFRLSWFAAIINHPSAISSFSSRKKSESDVLLIKSFRGNSVVALLLLNSKSKLVPDFALTVHFLHLVTTVLYTGRVPINLLWWGLQAGSANVMIGLGLWACRYRELRPISFGTGRQTRGREEQTQIQSELQSELERWDESGGTGGEGRLGRGGRGARGRDRSRSKPRKGVTAGPSYELVGRGETEDIESAAAG